jgi:hypothetical protein
MAMAMTMPRYKCDGVECEIVYRHTVVISSTPKLNRVNPGAATLNVSPLPGNVKGA